ncbi:hypothetical protein KZJ38_02710 [Paraburkholderia edwinii]|jgi:hypothetical protein|uniref:Uncharacterized protein n=1 Tax=Paraburkholderia edwinii TaxID=2861782 RepID=A0ABX8UJW0_9BURK|nr:hypothetical protein [Paraburkholderia edwinii]QYD69315.1 hypothetical protein KZJ38_02710 [Paraburkholderia edwinii]
MKRRTTRQMVRVLSDIRRSANCRALRAAAVIREMELAEIEAEEEERESRDTAREEAWDKPSWRTS